MHDDLLNRGYTIIENITEGGYGTCATTETGDLLLADQLYDTLRVVGLALENLEPGHLRRALEELAADLLACGRSL